MNCKQINFFENNDFKKIKLDKTIEQIKDINIKKMFFALAPTKQDIEAVRIMKPKNILLSYALWRKADKEYKLVSKKQIHFKERQNVFKEGMYSLESIIESFYSLDYYPTIILDSGGFSFKGNQVDSFKEMCINYMKLNNGYQYMEEYSDLELRRINELEGVIYIKDKNCERVDISFSDEFLANKVLEMIDSNDGDTFMYLNSEYQDFIDHIRYIIKNQKYIDYVVSLDDMNNGHVSKANWDLLRQIFPNVIPTYHFREDESVLSYYASKGAKYIGLGGTVFHRIENKNSIKSLEEVANWVNKCCDKYPQVKFHLFGSQNKKLNKQLISLYSVDGAAWAITAAKKCRLQGKSKVQLACELILQKEIFDTKQDYLSMENRIGDKMNIDIYKNKKSRN